jgi:hypothetical protein
VHPSWEDVYCDIVPMNFVTFQVPPTVSAWVAWIATLTLLDVS